LIALFASYLYYHKKQESLRKQKEAELANQQPQIQQIEYQEAVKIVKEKLQERYSDYNGYIAPYTRDPDMSFQGSIGTLRKALQENTQRPNREYIEKALNDLEATNELKFHVKRPEKTA
jgi:hypothetical protein